MKLKVTITAVAFALCAFSAAQAAMSTVPNLGPSDTEPNRLTGSNPSKKNNYWAPSFSPLNPYLSLAPSDLQPPPEKRDKGPGFLNADPFDPNSVVNSYERSLWANPMPYDPVYNPYGQGASPYAPRGGASVPMGNGIPYRR